MGQRQLYSKEDYRKMAHVVAPRNSKKRKHLNVKFPSSNLHQKAVLAEVFDKGLTANIFKIYFFGIVPRHIGSL